MVDYSTFGDKTVKALPDEVSNALLQIRNGVGISAAVLAPDRGIA